MDTATPAQYHSVAEAFPPELREACQRDLDQAARLAQGPEQPRVEFLRGGLKYVELTISAIERTIPLLDAGWKLTPAVVQPPNTDPAAFRAAYTAWEERDRYVESLKQDFVIAYFWIRYNEQNRSFVPLEKMRHYRESTR